MIFLPFIPCNSKGEHWFDAVDFGTLSTVLSSIGGVHRGCTTVYSQDVLGNKSLCKI